MRARGSGAGFTSVHHSFSMPPSVLCPVTSLLCSVFCFSFSLSVPSLSSVPTVCASPSASIALCPSLPLFQLMVSLLWQSVSDADASGDWEKPNAKLKQASTMRWRGPVWLCVCCQAVCVNPGCVCLSSSACAVSCARVFVFLSLCSAVCAECRSGNVTP